MVEGEHTNSLKHTKVLSHNNLHYILCPVVEAVVEGDPQAHITYYNIYIYVMWYCVVEGKNTVPPRTREANSFFVAVAS